MGKPMPRVWTPWQGTIQRPEPSRKSSAARPSSPRKRVQCVSATARAVARYASRVRLKACPCPEKSAMNTRRLPLYVTSSPCSVAGGDRPQLADQLNDGWSDGDEDNRRQNKDHQWGNHLDRSFGSLFFGALPAFRAEGVGMNAEGLSHAGAEAIRLNERANERADIVNAGSFDEIPQGLGAGLAGAHLKVHKMELVT